MLNLACVACGTGVAELAATCPKCGNPLRESTPSGAGVVFAGLRWLAALAMFFTGKTVMHEALGAAIGAGGVAWLAVLRTTKQIKGMLRAAGASKASEVSTA
jgi:hypothetical protein